MNKSKLITICKKLHINDSVKLTPQEWYNKITGSDLSVNFLNEVLQPKEIIIISFLLPYGNDIKLINDLYDLIVANIFSFSVFEVTEVNPYIDCDECDGGHSECRYCYGDGDLDCDDCNGSGEDDEGRTCDSCDGSGKVECDECDGIGSESCSYCDGTGETESTDTYDLNQLFMVSYDEKIRELILLNNEYKNPIMFEIFNDKSFFCYIRDARHYSDDELEQDIYYFIDYQENPNFKKKHRKIDVVNIEDIGS